MNRFSYPACLLACALAAAPCAARPDSGEGRSPLKGVIAAAEDVRKDVQDASRRLDLVRMQSLAAAAAVPEAAPVFQDLAGLLQERFSRRLAGAASEASGAAKDMSGVPPYCADSGAISRVQKAAAGVKRLGRAVEEAGKADDELRKTARAFDSRLLALAQGLQNRKEDARAQQVDRARLAVGADLLKAAEPLDKVRKVKPAFDVKALTADCVRKTPTAVKPAAPAASVPAAVAKSVPAAASLGKGGASAAPAAVKPAAAPSAPARSVPVESKPQEKKPGFGERLLDAGKSLFGIGSSVVRDAVGIVKDVPVGIAKDLWSAGGKLLKGDLKGAGMDVLKTPLHAVQRAGNGFADMAARTLLGGVDIVDTLILQKPLPRPLTAEEKTLLAGVYGDSVDLDKVRVRTGSSSHLFLPTHAVGNTIYFQDEIPALKNPDGTLTWEGRTLVHETGHVWQDQNGTGTYLPKAMFANIGAQVFQGDRNKCYEWKTPAAQGVPFEKLNPEQQASVIDALAADDQRPEGSKLLSPEETAYARAAMELVKARRGAP